jgi:hypothetical protein
MGNVRHFDTERNGNKNTTRLLSHTNENNIQNAEDNVKLTQHQQILQKWQLANDMMLRPLTKVPRRNWQSIPHQIQGTQNKHKLRGF